MNPPASSTCKPVYHHHLSHIHTKTIVIIAGPTAVGKTAAAVQLAQHFNTQIISADSRQCFRELNIGVAKPSAAELEAVHHFFINSHSIHDQVDAAVFEQYAIDAAAAIFNSNDVAIMVGGTGLYIKAFCDGVDEMPAIDEAIRSQVKTGYRQHGLAWVQQQVQEKDPVYYNNGETQNPQRLMRALEFVLATGRSIREFQKGEKKQRPFNIIKTGLELSREILLERINKRVDIMMAEGQLEEVRMLQPFQHLNALQTVGYRELFDHLNGLCSLDAAVEFIKTSTRQYAKRQMTWFKKDENIHWFHPADIEGIRQLIQRKMDDLPH